MDFSNVFVIIFFVGTFVEYFIDAILERIDWSFRKRHGMEIPPEVEGMVDLPTLERTVKYEDAKCLLWIPWGIITLLLNIYLVISGFYPAVFSTVCSWTGSSVLANLLFIVFMSIPGAILDIPFELYSTFGVEKRFGFCKMTFGTWISDKIKGIAVGLVISVPLLAVASLLFRHFPANWWILLGAVLVAFSLGLSVIYPLFIAPIFNKFTPLEDGELKTRLEGLLQKCGFRSSGLFVMDASRRSGHSNAYFTGFGRSKRVVLYDTLIEQLSADEIEAVLGHELGHYKNRHILKKMLVTVPLIFAVLFAISILIRLPSLYEGFGFDILKDADGSISHKMMMVGLIFSQNVFGGFSPIFSLATNHFSRRDEFQADAFSREVCGTGESLIRALVKLNRENLSEIQVPKIYSAFNYSHPPLLERIAALKEGKKA